MYLLCSSPSCISLYSYIKPQRFTAVGPIRKVVYLYIPTSNHNFVGAIKECPLLYIFIFLHQTTTGLGLLGCSLALYIFIFLHQTTTSSCIVSAFVPLYIFIFLHQTTTYFNTKQLRPCCISLYSYIKPQLSSFLARQPTSCISLYSYIKPQPESLSNLHRLCCISLYSYIKPQLPSLLRRCLRVVYLYIPTSNHNCPLIKTMPKTLYIFIFLHQTTTPPPVRLCRLSLYIFIFLHQTTTKSNKRVVALSCISLYSYIKPQL